MVDKIIKEIDKITKDVYLIDILMDHINNQYLIDKWVFTMKTYQNLLTEIKRYNDLNLKNTVNPNFIINDYETLTQMINEYKEDIYNLFTPRLFVLIDGLNNNLLYELSNLQKEIKKNYQTYNDYQNYILNNHSKLKNGLLLLKQELEKIVHPIEKKYIPMDNLNSLMYINLIDQDIYFNIYQLFTKMSRYYKENIELQNICKEIRFNMIMMMAGDKNV